MPLARSLRQLFRRPAPPPPLPKVRWRLESCACVLRYDAVDANDRFTNPYVEHDCGAHGSGLTAHEHFRKALAFNRVWAAGQRGRA